MVNQVSAPKVETRLTNHPKTTYSMRQLSGKCYNLTFGTRSRDIEEYQAAERRTKKQCWKRNTPTGDFLEDGRRLPLHSQAIQCSRADVEVRVRSAHNKNKDGRVDDVVQSFDSDLTMRCKMTSSSHSMATRFTSVVATTKGLAAAPVLDWVATKRDLFVLGTISPITNTPPT